MPLLSLDQVTLRYTAGGTAAVDGLCLELAPGETLALVGPSGCGKTTTLRLVAGFERPDTGTVTLEDRLLSGPGAFLPPDQRRVGMVFQDFALFPHLSVLDNVTFGLDALPRREQVTRARAMLELFGLGGFEARMPHTLSGGQQQRVALARALAPGPRVLLLDEPFSSLDAALRATTRSEVRRVLKSLETAVVLVTHDQQEAMAFADRLAVMRAGKVEQAGTPEVVYTTPRSAFVAWFLGGTNLVPGSAFGNGARTALGILPLQGEAKGPVLLSLRPESLRLVPDKDAVAVGGALRAEVLSREFQGHGVEFTVGCAGMELTVRGGPEALLRPGDRVRLEVVGKAVVLEDPPPDERSPT
ncbi:ABC transporter ATP-binding protein [Stigmatella sp. ncwal1]|uniref:ABC transporter ATP-binding protein n=1 Tax=Stigmatella ashevillensis TaxID=2995309 RepID=A0ABT5DBD1_9BACT|nr:ABC transporter ATP-binding protein [Stigmatella ashevillena]MDC0710826.1 ABC transporter ATP-binding protein [Stigmatella ashevillena]